MDLNEILTDLDKHHDLVNAAMAVMAVLVSCISLIFAAVTLLMQRSHNRKSVLPIGHFSIGDYEDDLFVRLRNDGIGPMIIERVSVMQKSTGQTQNAIIHFMPEDITWSTFVDDVSQRAISPEQYLTLLQLKGDGDDPEFAQDRQSVRRALASLTIKAVYKNVYGKRMRPTTRDLSWFGRNL